jgi:hypothetical protein
MPVNIVYILGASQLSVSGGVQLSGFNQGAGTHLAGQTITLNSNAWQAMNVFDSSRDASFDDSDASQTLSGAQTVDGIPYADGLRVEAEYGLTLRDPEGNEYTVLGFNINELGVTSYATVEGLAFVGGIGGFPPRDVPLTVVGTREGPRHAYSSLATPPCFTDGTLIETPGGPIAIEALSAGDIVLTADHGAQPIRWVGRTYLPAAVLAKCPEFRPIRIAKDAFGPGRPYRDTALSPQHRVLIDDWRATLFFGEDEVLAPACKLVNGTNVTIDSTARGVRYHHLAFDKHEVICGDGLMSESYLISSDTAPDARRELQTLMHQALTRGAMRAARVCVTARHCSLLRPAAPTYRETAPAASP